MHLSLADLLVKMANLRPGMNVHLRVGDNLERFGTLTHTYVWCRRSASFSDGCLDALDLRENDKSIADIIVVVLMYAKT